MTDAAPETEPKGERSPRYPFISLRKAEERAKQFWDKHRKEAARIAIVATTWEYGIKSSGLQQTIGALKQYGLLEDARNGEDRKVQLTELGRRLVVDQREGVREAARKEAAANPRLFKEYAHWINDPPSDSHCLSELELDRGFNELAARTFLKAFKDTVAFARLRDASSHEDAETPEEHEVDEKQEVFEKRASYQGNYTPPVEQLAATADSPLSERLKVQVTVGAVSVSAHLKTQSEIDTVIRFLEANKILLSP